MIPEWTIIASFRYYKLVPRIKTGCNIVVQWKSLTCTRFVLGGDQHELRRRSAQLRRRFTGVVALDLSLPTNTPRFTTPTFMQALPNNVLFQIHVKLIVPTPTYTLTLTILRVLPKNVRNWKTITDNNIRSNSHISLDGTDMRLAKNVKGNSYGWFLFPVSEFFYIPKYFGSWKRRILKHVSVSQVLHQRRIGTDFY